MSYKKLVRDKIPEIISANGETPITKILSDIEYKLELEKKLIEEAQEVINASGHERLEELADLLEVMIAIAKLEKSDLRSIKQIQEEKRSKRGGFDKKIYLINVKND